jgi:hypothetical protein
MKRILILAALVHCLIASAAFADDSNAEAVEAVVNARMSIYFAYNNCGTKLTDGWLNKLADRNGVDAVKVEAAIIAALHANIDEPYDRKALIPAVTVTVKKFMDAMFAVDDDKKMCAILGPQLKSIGAAK